MVVTVVNIILIDLRSQYWISYVGFSLGLMNKNYAADKQITSVYMFPYIGLYLTKALVINITVIPTSKIAKGWTAGNEWPTTLFFQYKLRITKWNSY